MSSSDLYTILINDDHSFSHSNKKRIMRRSNMIDTIRFLVKPIYGVGATKLDMTKVNVVLEYVTPVLRNYKTIKLEPEAELYKNRIQYLLPLDLSFTAEPGELELTINFSYLSQDKDGNFVEQVRPIGSTSLEITDTPKWSDYIPTTDLDNIAQIMLANQAIAEQNRINAELIKTEMPKSLVKDENNNIYLVNEDGIKVGESVVDDSGNCDCEDGVPIVDFSVAEPDDGTDEKVDNVVEF